METTGMSALVTALTSAISLETMIANVTTLIPFIGGLVIFAFIYRLVKAVTNALIPVVSIWLLS